MCMVATATASQAITVSTHDVDRNYVINGSDVTALYNILLSDTGTAQGGDVDNNGVVNGSDVTALYNFLLGEQQAPALMSIAKLKEKYWQDDREYATTIDEDIVIAGRVTSSDEAGNIYKQLYLEDNTGAIAISLNAANIYRGFPLGQQIEIALRDLAIGKYNNQLLIGEPEWYNAGNTWETGRMAINKFLEHVQKIGSPQPENVVPTVCSIADVAGKTDADTQLAFQNRLVTFNDVEWRDANLGTPFVGDSYSTMYRDIIDMEGNSIPVTISGYSNFCNNIIPMGWGNVTGVLSYIGTGFWRLYLRDENDYSGFSSTTKGMRTDPLTVDEAINIDHDGLCWVKGNIVGATTAATVESNADVEWNAPFTAGAALVIGNEATTRDLAHCLVIELPAGSAFATSADMGKYPELLGCEILVRGIIGTVKGTHGITGNNGTEDEFVMNKLVGGVTALNETFENGLPADWTQVQVQGNKKWYTTTFNSNTYAAMTGYRGTPPFESWLITPVIDIKNAPKKTLSFRSQVNNYGSTTTTKLEVYVLSSKDPTTAVKVQLHPTLATAPASGYSDWTLSGDIDLSAFADGSYCIGFVYTADNDTNYATTWVIDDVKIGE